MSKKTIQAVTDIICKKLDCDVDDIDINEAFFSMGIESILVQEIIDELGELYGALNTTVLFEYPNIVALSEHLENLSGNVVDEEEISVKKSQRVEASKIVEEQVLSEVERLEQKSLDSEKISQNGSQMDSLTELIARKLDCDPNSIDVNESFFSLGVESILGQEIVDELSEKFSGLSATIMFEYPNIKELSQFLDKMSSYKKGKVEESKEEEKEEAKPEPPPQEVAVQTTPPLTVPRETTTENVPLPDNVEKIKSFLCVLFAQILGVDLLEFNSEDSFFNMKMEPSQQEEIIHQLQTIFGPLDEELFFEYSGMNDLSEYLATLPYSEDNLQIPEAVDEAPAPEPVEEKEELPVEPVSEPAVVETKQAEPKPESVKPVREFETVEEEKVNYPAKNDRGYGIAVIGMSGRFPQAPTLDQLWENLLEGKDCIEEIPNNRWDYSLFFDEDQSQKNKTHGKWGGFIEEVDMFDPLFFKISPREAEIMDPQQRLFLEVSWEALEDAGYAVHNKLNKERVSVYTGVIWNEYSQYSNEEGLLKNSYGGPGSLYWMIPNRVSYVFNFSGPSIALDTACSASLTAVHMACQSILTGESTMSLAGGVNLSLHPSKYLFLGQAKFLAKDGRCRSFGAGGSGYVPGEGVAAVLLKPLERAVEDGDRIYGVIRGTSVNHDGGATGFTVPNPGAQKELILTALKAANVNPEEIGYIECHGTGTELGDPVELKGLANAFRQYTDKLQFCPIGSLKANIGHLEGAAGIAGFIKVMLCLSKKMIPKSIHSKTLNPNLDFTTTPFYVARENQPWEVSAGKKRIAALSSFGAGGSNSHAVLEEYPTEKRVDPVDTTRMEAVLLSAQSAESLTRYAERLIAFIEKKGDEVSLRDLAHTLQTGREAFDYRILFLATSNRELKNRLEHFVENGEPGEGTFTGVIQKRKKEKTLLDDVLGNQEVFKILIRQEDVSTLGKFWLEGAKIDWSLLYEKQRAEIISLPHYPFAKRRFWIPEEGGKESHHLFKPTHYMHTGTEALHPLIDANVSTQREYKYKKTLGKDQFIIREHIVGHQYILPGVGYLEMVRCAGKLFCETEHEVQLKNVLWLRPIIVDDKPVETFVGLTPKGAKINYEVYSFGSSGERITHSKGDIISESAGSPHKLKKLPFSVNALKERCIDFVRTDKTEIYQIYTLMEFHYGESFRCTEAVHCNEEESIGFLTLPLDTEGGGIDFTLHPSLMDSALRVSMCIPMSTGKKVTNPNVPFSLGKLETFGPLPKQCVIYAKRTSNKKQRESGIEKYDIYVCNTKSEILAKMTDFLTRPYIDKTKPKEKTPVQSVLYRQEWIRNELSSEQLPGSQTGDKNCLIFLDQGESEVVVKNFNKPVIVQVADSYGKVSPRHYRMNPFSFEQYRLLMFDLKQDNLFPDQIIHLWSFVGGSFNMNVDQSEVLTDLANRDKMGILSAFYLFKTINELDKNRDVTLLFLSPTPDQNAYPGYESVRGFAKTLTKVNFKFKLISLGIDRQTFQQRAFFQQAAEELSHSENRNGTELLYKESRRYVRTVAPPDSKVFEIAKDQPSQIKEGGVYLITGGAGGLGFVFARYLAKTYRAKLILTGRSPLTPDKEQIVRKLQDYGAEALYIPADVANYDDMHAVMQKVKERYGVLNGILHSAGVMENTPIAKSDHQIFSKACAPKVEGTVILDLLTKDDPLDFFFLFSSVSSIFGDFGSGSYAAANRFLDGFAEYRTELVEANQRSGKTVAVLWPYWKEGAMKIPKEEESLYFDYSGLTLLDTDLGMEVFERSLQMDFPHLIAVDGDHAKIRRVLQIKGEDAPHKPVASAPKPKASVKKAVSVAPPEKVEPPKPVPVQTQATDIQSMLVRMTADLLKMEPSAIDVEKDLAEYGADSVMIMEFQQQLVDKFGDELPSTILFEYSTIASLAEYLEENFGSTTVAVEESAAEIIPTTSMATAEAAGVDIQSMLVQMTADLLKMDPSAIDVEKDLAEYGADSVMIMEFQQQLVDKFGDELPSTILFEYSTIASLAEYLTENFTPQAEVVTKTVPTSPVPVQPVTTEAVPAKQTTASATDIQAELVQMTADLLKMEPAAIDVDKDLAEYGADSVMIMEFQQQLVDKFGDELPSTILFEYSTIASLAEYLVENFAAAMSVETPVAATATTFATTTPSATVAGGGKEQILARLIQITSNLLKIADSSIDTEKDLTDYGMDSVVMMELRQELVDQYGEDEIPTTLLFDCPTIASIAQFLFETFPPSTGDAVSVEKKEPETVDVTEAASSGNINQELVEITAKIIKLPASQINLETELTDYGLDSVMMMELRQELVDRYGEEIPQSLLFEYPTISSIAGYLVDEGFVKPEAVKEIVAEPAATEAASKAEVIPKDHILPDSREREGERTRLEPEEKSYPLSHAQLGQWYIASLDPECCAYNVPTAAVLNWKVDIQALTRAFEELLIQQPSLRTIFREENDEVQQIVLNYLMVSIQQEDATAWTDEEIKARIEKETKTPFDLQKGPLWRALLLTHSEEKYTLIVTVHHIVYDGLSTVILIKELFDFYEKELEGRLTPAEPLTKEYAEFIRWQQDFVTGKRGERSLEYWKEQLSGEIPPLELPFDKTRPEGQTYNGNTHVFNFDSETANRLKELAKQNKTTLFNVLVTAYFIMLYRNTGQEDILVGIPTLGRTTGGYEKTIGYFVNMVALRANLLDNPAFPELLKQITKSTRMGLAHQDYPFSLLVNRLNVARDPSRSPIFQTDFMLQNFDTSLTGSLAQKGVDIYYPKQQEGQFDLTMEIFDNPDQMIVNLKYNQDLFEENTILRFAGHFQMIVQGILENPEYTIQAIPILQSEERQQLLVDWNRTQVDYPKDLGLHQLFELWVEETPDAVASVFNGEEISYRDLNAKANRLAHHIQELGVKPNTMIGIFMERSLDLLAGLLAILKSGAAYIPMDPSFPTERLGYMLEDSEAPVIVTEKKLLEMLPEHNAKVVVVDQIADQLAGKSEENPSSEQKPDDLAYVIFTSGSTGRPKGVQIHHRAVVNFTNSMSKIPGFTASDALLSVTTISFDISILEMFLPLSQGGTVVIASREDALDGDRLQVLMKQHNITVMQATPATWRLLEEAEWQGSEKLKVLCGGEPLPPDLAKILLARAGSLWNMYGPTETTIWSTLEKVEKDRKILIGRPIDNTDIFILNPKLEPAPVGVAGLLYIGGDGLSKGYLKRPDLTAEKFIQSPFNEDPNCKIYDTGDLARYMPDGNIECLGRVDNQVKIRGFRIELGDIEAALSHHVNIKVNAVVAKDVQGDKILVAYFVPLGKTPSTSDLINYLKEHLPFYMIPSLFTQMEEMPLTPNGKIDRKSLPDPVVQVAEEKKGGALPQNEVERIIAKIWQDVLQIKEVGIHDNFFDLGGHSLRMAKVHARLKKEVNAEVTLIQLLQYPTIHSLAQSLAGPDADAPDDSLIKRVVETESSNDIAIIGLAGRFPKAKNPNELWEKIRKGEECITVFSDEELEEAGVPKEEYSHESYVKARGYLEDIGWFDNELFGFSPMEAKITDPQQRLFLEVVWEALEDAGYDSFRTSFPIGVFAGSGMNNYLTKNIHPNNDLVDLMGEYNIMVGNDKDFLCTRASYKLNLGGPSLVVQSACSSSLAAIDAACHALRYYSCEIAIAGGVSLLEHGKKGYLYQEGMILSPDGHCRTFDSKASGTLSANGSGVVVLKRINEAIEDRDHIYAVIKGSAINNDGSLKLGYTAPRVEGQAIVVRSAQNNANVEPESISYIEAHGTATKLGDPIEISALTQAFRVKTKKTGFCRIGSLKSNLGHLDAAAGVAGVIKTALSLKHKQIPPTLHYESSNPEIDFENSPFVVNDKLTDWDFVDAPRRAGVSSFGIGGTNAHIILEEAPPADPSKSERPDSLFLVSARTETALAETTGRLTKHLKMDDTINPEDVAYTLQIGRREFEHRAVYVVQGQETAITALESDKPQKSKAPETSPSIIFMFSGQGSQYVNMGRQLYDLIPVFKKEVDYCFGYLKDKLDLDLRPIIFPDEGNEKQAKELLNQTRYTQPALFVIEYSLAKTWMDFGIRPDYMIGHSVGEYVAACLAGVFSLEDGLELIVTRGKLIWDLPQGDMLSIPLSEADIGEYLNEELSIATINTPNRCVVSGSSEKIKELSEKLGEKDIRTAILHTSHAFHSFMMEPMLPEFEEKLSKITMHEPGMKYISNVTGTWITGEEATKPKYWGQHLRGAVRYADGIRELSWLDNTVFLEVGPGTVLTTLTNQNLREKQEKVVLSSMKHVTNPQTDYNLLLTTIGRLWLAGKTLNWENFHHGDNRGRIPLPTYPFERKLCWVEETSDDERSEEVKTKTTEAPASSGQKVEKVSKSVDSRDISEDLRALWKEFLGVNNCEDHDDFFNLGGDSLLAVSVISKVKKKFHVELPPHALIEHPLFSSFRDFVQEKAGGETVTEDSAKSSLVEVQKGVDQLSPLFMVHSTGGGVVNYQDLGKEIERGVPLYEFQYTGSDQEADISVEELASQYLKELKQFRPSGPYKIGGHSFGGVIALEMAHQLKTSGDEVELLLVIGTPGIGKMPQDINDTASVLCHLFGNQLSLSESSLRKLDEEQQLDFVLSKAKKVEKSKIIPKGLDISFLHQFLIHQQAMVKYKMTPIDVPILFFEPTEKMRHFPANLHGSWKKLAQGDFNSFKVDGNHLSVMHRSNIKQIAEQLGKLKLKGSAESERDKLVEVVTFQQGNPDKAPLFLVHPVGGEVYFYRDLANHLEKDQPMYAFRCCDEKSPFTSIQEMAKYYINELLTFSDKEDLYLGGASFGGVVALEMVRQLQQMGKNVKGLFMIDSPSLDLSVEEALDSATALESLLGGLPDFDFDQFKGMEQNEALRMVQEKAKELDIENLISGNLDLKLQAYQKHVKALYEYTPDVYEKQAAYFYHTESMKRFPDGNESYWRDILKGNAEFIKTGGNHITMNMKPHVETIAKVIIDWIE